MMLYLILHTTIVAIFKDSNAVFTPELWNPGTEKWSTMAPHSVPRNYHSVAILLKDARVLVGGGGLCGTCNTNHPDFEVSHRLSNAAGDCEYVTVIPHKTDL